MQRVDESGREVGRAVEQVTAEGGEKRDEGVLVQKGEDRRATQPAVSHLHRLADAYVHHHIDRGDMGGAPS